MPTYEYACSTCHHRFEAWQKMSDEPLTICPECNARIHRVLYPAGIVFKGSGFYKTDHGNGTVKGKSGEEKKANGTTSETKASGESKTTTENGSSGKVAEQVGTTGKVA